MTYESPNDELWTECNFPKCCNMVPNHAAQCDNCKAVEEFEATVLRQLRFPGHYCIIKVWPNYWDQTSKATVTRWTVDGENELRGWSMENSTWSTREAALVQCDKWGGISIDTSVIRYDKEEVA